MAGRGVIVIASDLPAKAWQAGAWQSRRLNPKSQFLSSKQIQISKFNLQIVLGIHVLGFDIV
jgi:hypothetical protein